MKQLNHTLTIVSFFLVVVGATIFPFITSENDPVQVLALDVVNGEQTTFSGQDNIAQDAGEMGLPCVIHCNPPYNASVLPAREINTTADEPILYQIDTVTYPFLNSEDSQMQTLVLGAVNGEQDMFAGQDGIVQDTGEIEFPCLIHCNPPYDVPALSAREINTISDDLMWDQINTGEFCLIHCQQLNHAR